VLAAPPREAFFLLGRFALAQAQRASDAGHGSIRRAGLARRLDEFLRREPATSGSAFLREAISYGARLAFDPDDWVFELASAILGDPFPERARMLSHCESVVHAFFVQGLGAVLPHDGHFEIAATAGNGASWGYAAQAMVANRLLSAGDQVAIGAGRLPSGMELPNVGVYGLQTVDILPDQAGSGFPETEIDKLADPTIKAFFVISPAGDGRAACIDRLASIIRGDRPDLLVLADESLATLADGSRSFAAVLPGSVLSTYSFAAHFGAAGWQLGVVALHSANAFDLALAELPHRIRRRLARRYALIGRDRRIAFIDRVAAESGCLAAPGAAGLSAPQQVQAALFALFGLVGFGRSDTPTLAAHPSAAESPAARVPDRVELRPGRPTSRPMAGPAGQKVIADLLAVARGMFGAAFAT
jgi:aspartate 4-decarboxylase